MTTPAPPTVADLPATYTVDGLTFGRYDEDGTCWIPQKTEGWHEAAPKRNSRTARTAGDGSFRGPAWTEERVIVIEGIAYCPDVGARLSAEDRFNALCDDPGSLFEFVARDQRNRTRTAMVERSGGSKFTLRNERVADFQLTLAAPDPRKHDGFWQEPRAWSPVSSAGGVDDSGGGYDYSAGGLDYGTAAESTDARVGNYGTATARPFFVLRGPLPTPAIVCAETGEIHNYLADVAAAETISINCDYFPARGFPAQSATSNIRGDVTALFAVGIDWPAVPAQTSASYRLLAAGTGEALTAALRSAWR